VQPLFLSPFLIPAAINSSFWDLLFLMRAVLLRDQYREKHFMEKDVFYLKGINR